MDTHPTDDRLWDALATWEAAYTQGRDLSAYELCHDCPELVTTVQNHVTVLKRTLWMTQTAVDRSDPLPLNTIDLIPKLLGEYTVLEPLGMGGQGSVFKAIHRRMDRTVAIKLLPRSTPEAATRFQTEVRAAAKLVHPNIVTAFDAGECDGISFLVMEFTEGVDLHRHVQEHGPLSVEQAVNCLLQAAKGLAFAHDKGILHCDVKPANLLLCNDGTVKILDLGLAQLRDTQAEIALGTPDFLAPELAIDPSKADPRSDIYALGCTLWVLLTGKPIFHGDTVIQKILAHREQPVPSLRTVRPDVPAAINALFRRMVAKHPEARPGSAADCAKAVERSSQTPGRRTWARGVWVGIVALTLGSLVLLGNSFRPQYTPNPSQPDHAQERRAAEWALRIGGKAVVETADGKQTAAAAPTDLPAVPFVVKRLDVQGRSSATDEALAVFNGLGHIADLNLSKTPISDAGTVHLAGLASLEVLRLNETAVSDQGLHNLDGLTKLTMLELGGTKVTNDGLKHLAKMQELNWLLLTDSKITNDGLRHLQHLPNLRELRLARLRITDEGVGYLSACTELRLLELYETDVTDEATKNLVKLKNLSWLSLTGTKLTDQGLGRLQALDGLRTLRVERTKVTAAGVREFQAARPETQVHSR